MAAPPQASSRVGGTWVWVVVAGMLVMGRLVTFSFINYDDPVYVTENPHVLSGLSVDGFVWGFGEGGVRSSNLVHPVTWIWLQGVAEMGGSEPWPYHLSSLLLHILCMVLLFRVALDLTGSPSAAFLSSLLFGLHPQRVQSVAWISQHKDLLSGAGVLLAVLAWVRFRNTRNRGWWAASLAAAAFAMLSKPVAVVVPVWLLAMDYVRGPDSRSRRSWPHILLPLGPPMLLAAGLAAATVWAQRSGGLAGVGEALGWPMRLKLIPAGLGWYIEKAVLPWPLPFFVYPPGGTTGWILAALGLTALAGTAWVILGTRRSRPVISLGLAWFLIGWLPVSGLVTVSLFYVSDRYMYLPHIGLALAAGASLDRAGRWGRRAGLALVVALATLTAIQIGYWKDSETLFSREMAINPRSLLAPVQVGFVALEANRLEDAASFFEQAIAIDPRAWIGHRNLGIVRERQGRSSDAMDAYQDALRDPGCPRTVRGDVMKLQVETVHPSAALETLQQAIADPATPANTLTEMGLIAARDLLRPEAAMPAFQAAISRDPGAAAAWQAGGVCLLGMGRPHEAVPWLERAAALRPEDPAIREAVAEAMRVLGTD